MKFTMGRNITIASTFGHSVRFEKGVPMGVPPSMYPEVLAAGGVPDEDTYEEPKLASAVPQSQHEREQAMFEVFEKLVLADRSGDFTSGGTPRDKTMERELGWPVDAKETAAAWKKFRQQPAE